MAKGIKRRLRSAQLNTEIRIAEVSQGGKFAAGLGREGYWGGYAAALADVSLMLDGCSPCVQPELWRPNRAKTLEEVLA